MGIIRTGKGDLLCVSIQLLSIDFALLPPFAFLGDAMTYNLFGDLEENAKYNLVFKLYTSFFPRTLRGDICVRVLFMAVLYLIDYQACRDARFFMDQWMIVVRVTRHLLEGDSILQNRNLDQALRNYRVLYLLHAIHDRSLAQLLHVAYQAGTFITVVGISGFVPGFRDEEIVERGDQLLCFMANDPNRCQHCSPGRGPN